MITQQCDQVAGIINSALPNNPQIKCLACHNHYDGRESCGGSWNMLGWSNQAECQSHISKLTFSQGGYNSNYRCGPYGEWFINRGRANNYYTTISNWLKDNVGSYLPWYCAPPPSPPPPSPPPPSPPPPSPSPPPPSASPSPPSPTGTVYVSECDTALDSVVSASASSVAELKALVDDSTTTCIRLAAGTYQMSAISPHIYHFSVSKPLAIVADQPGGGVVIDIDAGDGSGATAWTARRAFDVAPAGSLVLRELEIIHGDLANGEFGNYWRGGGALRNHGNLTVPGCKLRHNRASTGGWNAYGGAIINWGSATLTMYDTEVSHNWANQRAGALYAGGSSVRLFNCNFTANEVNEGSMAQAVYVDGNVQFASDATTVFAYGGAPSGKPLVRTSNGGTITWQCPGGGTTATTLDISADFLGCPPGNG